MDYSNKARNRRWAKWLVLPLAATVVGGAYETSEARVEGDLNKRTEQAAAEAGFDITARYSGQDAHVTCLSPTTDIEGLKAVIAGVKGARDPEGGKEDFLDVASCTAAPAAEEPAAEEPVVTEPVVTEAPAVSALDVQAVLEADAVGVVLNGTVDTDQQKADLVAAAEDTFGPGNVTDNLDVAGNPADLGDANVASLGSMIAAMRDNVVSAEAGFSPSNGLYFNGVYSDDDDKDNLDAALGALGDLEAGNVDLTVAEQPAPDLEAAAVLENGSSKITLRGTVQSEAQRQALVAAAAATFGAEDVIDELVIAPNGASTADTDDLVNRMGTIAGYVNGRMSEAEAGIKNGQLYVRGTYVSATAKDEIEAKAAEVGIEPAAVEIEPLAAATAECAAQLTTDINALVAANPIPFDPGSANLAATAGGLLDQVQALALSCGTSKIEVQGYTDADGSDASNLALSQRRADTVLAALVERGVAAEQLVAVGYGEADPLAPNDTPENKAKNRRVVFAVAAQ